MTIQTAEDKDKNQVLDTWSRRIPRSTIARPLSRTQITDFCQTSHRLIQLHDAPTTHRVITELASEGGLTRVAELVKLTELSLTYVYLELCIPRAQIAQRTSILTLSCDADYCVCTGQRKRMTFY